AALLEEVDRREALLQAPGVGEDDRAERALAELVPHEPEAFLAGRAEQVQHVVRVEGDAAEVHGHGRLDLVLDAVEVVGAGADRGEEFLRAERRDLADRADEGRLAHAEPARHEDLQRGGEDVGAVLGAVAVVRAVVVVHRALPPEGPGPSGCGGTRGAWWSAPRSRRGR